MVALAEYGEAYDLPDPSFRREPTAEIGNKRQREIDQHVVVTIAPKLDVFGRQQVVRAELLAMFCQPMCSVSMDQVAPD